MTDQTVLFEGRCQPNKKSRAKITSFVVKEDSGNELGGGKNNGSIKSLEIQWQLIKEQSEMQPRRRNATIKTQTVYQKMSFMVHCKSLHKHSY